MTRTVAITGSEVKKPAYCKLKVGALLTDILAGNVNKDKELRYISGNPLTGKQIPANGFLGAFHSQVTVIPEGNDVHEMLGWIMPRFNEFSTSHSYFSWLMGKKEYTLDARIKGGELSILLRLSLPVISTAWNSLASTKWLLKISLSASSYVLRRWNFSVSFAKVLTCSVVKCANEFFS